jgi:hypothetical protein
MYTIKNHAEQKICKFSLACLKFRKSVTNVEFLVTGAYASCNWIRMLYETKRASVGDSEGVM